MVYVVSHLTWLTNILPMRSCKNPTIKSKQFFVDYLLGSSLNVEDNHMVGLFLEVDMDTCTTLAFP